MGKNKKIYIEFFGLSGSGKSTICNTLAEEMKKNGLDAISQKKEFMRHSKIYRHIIPILYTIFKLRFNVFRFLLYIQQNFEKERRGLRKYFFITQWFLHFYSGSHIFLSDEGLIGNIILSNKDTLMQKISYEKTIEILKFYPQNITNFFIFVDASPQIAYKRLITLRRKDCKPLRGEELIKKELLYNKNKEIFSFLKKHEEKINIKKVIRINGEKSINENVKFLNEQLNKYINK
jgi:thymidylate kinase